MSAYDQFEAVKRAGWSAISDFVATRTAEGLHLEFKQSSDDGRGPMLSEEDARNLSKSVTAFANTDGGTLVFGIKTKKEDDGDKADRLRPLTDCRVFAELVRKRLDDTSDPKVPGVRVEAIDDGTGSGAGAVAIHIPRSPSLPHKARARGVTDFYMRTEVGVTPIPYALLAALFGRMPAPQLAVRIVRRSASNVGLWVENLGAGTARSPYVRIELTRDGNDVGVSAENQADGWYRLNAQRMGRGVSLNYYLDHNRVLYPRHAIQVIDLVAAGGSFDGVILAGFVVCEGAPPVEYEVLAPEIGTDILSPSADA